MMPRRCLIPNKGKQPMIYVRLNRGKILYIGETSNVMNGRPFRDEPKLGDWDFVRLIHASSDVKRRRYWEAYLICKLKPLNQNTASYYTLVKKTNNNTNILCDFTDPDELKKAQEEISIDMLNKLRRKNNRERTIYWGRQIELAEQHKKQAMSFFKHFYHYWQLDRELDKKKKVISLQKYRNGDGR
tara:strand:+ start:494 stop:1051 length:558 start_codon:yes stop_codon:yes gene_type:complete